MHRVQEKKVLYLIISHNFYERRFIFKILSVIDLQGNSLCTCHREFHFT